MQQKIIKLPEMDPRLVADEIGEFIVNTIINTYTTGGIVGLSGGVDSTVTAAIAKRGIDKYNQKSPKQNLELVGYILPSKLNSEQSTQDGVFVARALGTRYEVQNISPIIEAFNFTNPEVFNPKNKYDKGNLISRIRANVISTKAATERKVLLGTGNKDEDFGVGYYTLFGDGAVHCSPIGNLSKRLVKQMSSYLGFQKIAQKEPTAELEEGQTDFNDLGYGYDVVELVLEGEAQGFSLEELISNTQIRELTKAQLQINKKFSSVQEVVTDILRRHYEVALPKTQIIHPPIAQITLTY
jgi:NAD+ synthase